jgi:hypothetical protein
MINANQENRGVLMNGRRFIVGLGVAGAGMLAAAFAQLAAAPVAGADVQDMITELDGTLQVGQTALTNAADSFADGNVLYGLDYGFGALDTYSLDPLADVLYGGYESLVGAAGPYPDFGFYYIQNPVPETLSAANADAAADLGYFETDLSTAVTDFGSADYADGATAAFAAIGGLITAPEVEVLGLVDALNIGTL